MSVVTCSLNAVKFIEHTLGSVREQTYPRTEHVVIDGGSVDGTIDVLRRLEGTCDLRWTSQRDAGLSDAFNRGLAEARGEWVVFLNADDTFASKDVLDSVMSAIADTPGFDVYMGRNCTIDADGGLLTAAQPFRHDVFTQDVLLNDEPTVVHQGTFYRRQVLLDVGGYRTDFRTHMDYELHLRVASRHPIRALDVTVACLRVHPEAKSQQMDPARFKELHRARRMHGGKLLHRHTLFFLRGYLSSARWSRGVYQTLLGWRWVRWLLSRLGVKDLTWS